MLIHNIGAIGAALHLAGINLPSHFNVDEGFVENAKDAIKSEFVHLDDDAHRILAIVKAAAMVEAQLLAAKVAADVAPIVEAVKEAVPKIEADAKQAGQDAVAQVEADIKKDTVQ